MRLRTRGFSSDCRATPNNFETSIDLNMSVARLAFLPAADRTAGEPHRAHSRWIWGGESCSKSTAVRAEGQSQLERRTVDSRQLFAHAIGGMIPRKISPLIRAFVCGRCAESHTSTRHRRGRSPLETAFSRAMGPAARWRRTLVSNLPSAGATSKAPHRRSLRCGVFSQGGTRL
jgi:hypothetical protein